MRGQQWLGWGPLSTGSSWVVAGYNIPVLFVTRFPHPISYIIYNNILCNINNILICNNFFLIFFEMEPTNYSESNFIVEISFVWSFFLLLGFLAIKTLFTGSQSFPIFVPGYLGEGNTLSLYVSHLLVQMFLFHYKLEDMSPFHGNVLGWQQVGARQGPLCHHVCRPPKPKHSVDHAQHFHTRKMANILKNDEQLKLQRALGPLRWISILLGLANLFWVVLHLTYVIRVQEPSVFIRQNRTHWSFLYYFLQGS